MTPGRNPVNQLRLGLVQFSERNFNKEETVTSRTLTLITFISLLVATAIPTRLAGQELQEQVPTFTVLYAFPVVTDGYSPNVILRDTAGNLYGSTSFGGSYRICVNHVCIPGCQGLGCGAVFKLDPTGKEAVLHNFDGTDGRVPSVSLRDSAGNLYGTTFLGGSGACPGGCGLVFKMDSAGKETVLHTFSGSAGGWYPSGNLARDSAGNFYGATVSGGDLACHGIEGSGTGCGVVFKLDATGKETVLHTFRGADGASPTAGLVRDSEGNLYGTTVAGGNLACSTAGGCGVVFKLNTTGKETVLHRFTGGADGGYPTSLLRDALGNLYGMTYSGGSTVCSGGCGVIFKLNPTGTETVLHRFTGVDGRGPFGGLLRDAEGNLYGTTSSGGQSCFQVGGVGCGVVFKLDMTRKETVLHKFMGGMDGWNPVAGLVRDAAGNLYGTTSYGGQLTCTRPASNNGCGVIFKLIP
jgi:uncharacterized repeat protein (TIGR03803 family)